MQTPVEIDFQGMRATPSIRTSIGEHVDELERRYGRITACRVVLKAPGGHHRSGGLYSSGTEVRFIIRWGLEMVGERVHGQCDRPPHGAPGTEFG
jgi:hypothetical protein